LDSAVFANKPVNERTEYGLGAPARRIIDQVEDLAEGHHGRDDHDHDRDHDGGRDH